jgi:hypothetical protein
MSFVLSDEANQQLAQWPPRARALLDELFDDAGSDLQREFIQRAIAAAHTPAEVHAFADELRSMTDEEAYERCTLEDAAPEDYTVTQLLRAEADPLFAFELLGGTIEPNEGDAPITAPRPTLELEVPTTGENVMDLVAPAVAKKKSSDSFESALPVGGRPKKLDWNDLGHAKPPPPKKDAGPPTTGGTRFLESLLAEATRGLSIAWREQDVDVPGGLTMADALASAAGALSRGIPVPCAVGPAPGEHRRFIVLMQLSTSGKTRSWQLYDPFSSELLWANEGDLLAKAELPFANKMNRRLTRIVLPQSLRASF